MALLKPQQTSYLSIASAHLRLIKASRRISFQLSTLGTSRQCEEAVSTELSKHTMNLVSYEYLPSNHSSANPPQWMTVTRPLYELVTRIIRRHSSIPTGNSKCSSSNKWERLLCRISACKMTSLRSRKGSSPLLRTGNRNSESVCVCPSSALMMYLPRCTSSVSQSIRPSSLLWICSGLRSPSGVGSWVNGNGIIDWELVLLHFLYVDGSLG